MNTPQITRGNGRLPKHDDPSIFDPSVQPQSPKGLDSSPKPFPCPRIFDYMKNSCFMLERAEKSHSWDPLLFWGKKKGNGYCC